MLRPCTSAGSHRGVEMSVARGGSAPALAGENPGEPRRDFRLLIVEDDEIFCHFLVATFRAYTSQIEIAGSVEQARARISDLEIDVATVDLQLPDGSGLALIDELRAHCPRAAIVTLTGDSESGVIADALNRGADSYMVKPVSPKDLRATVGAVLRRRQLPAPPAVAPPRLSPHTPSRNPGAAQAPGPGEIEP